LSRCFLAQARIKSYGVGLVRDKGTDYRQSRRLGACYSHNEGNGARADLFHKSFQEYYNTEILDVNRTNLAPETFLPVFGVYSVKIGISERLDIAAFFKMLPLKRLENYGKLLNSRLSEDVLAAWLESLNL
jgi:hypothetical protein